MSKIIKVGDSKQANEKILCNMQMNLKRKFNRYTAIEIYVKGESDLTVEFRVAFVPGFDGNDCSSQRGYNWKDFLQLYRRLMKGETDLLDNT